MATYPTPHPTAVADDPADSSVAVEIYDQVYQLRGSDTAYLQHLADVVDRKMRQVAAGGTVDSLRVAVLASLNLADELATLRTRHSELSGQARRTETAMRSRSASLADLLDEVFDEVDGVPADHGMRRAG